ncbi:flagellin [Paracoccus ravus]|uniref:flagellin N-terminal helical domain-containing protein n=1 Tax=Paracoccus ravus TaxID=2447760 RepID=UPI00106EA447|nr:flagellin [Paracoccus ravus]
MSSILTNNSALVALQTLKGINSNLAKTQAEISTGKTIGSAKDNAAIWAISKTMESDQQSFKTIQANLNVAGETVATARTGAEQVQGLLEEVKQLVIGAGRSDADIDTLNTQITAKMEQIDSIVNGTQANGVNLLNNTTPTYNVIGSLDRSGSATLDADSVRTISVTGTDLSGISGIDAGTGALATNMVLTGGATPNFDDVLATVESKLSTVIDAAATLGASGQRISDQATFVSKLSDSLEMAVSSLVDADMEEASARLTALQTQQQLGIQALSIANQAPSAIMSLFRG